MSLAQYLIDNNIDQIEDDNEFCENEHDIIAEYFQLYRVDQEDIEEAETRGYDISYFISE